MNAAAEIDQAGRLVVPKKLRDALHLVSGTRVDLELAGDTIVLRHEIKPRGLFLKNGILVYDCGLPPSNDIGDWVRKDRQMRDRSVFGDLDDR